MMLDQMCDDCLINPNLVRDPEEGSKKWQKCEQIMNFRGNA